MGSYKIEQYVFLKGTVTSELGSDDSRGSGEKGGNGEQGDSTILPRDLEEHAHISDQQNCSKSTLMGSDRECISARVSEKSDAELDTKSDARAHSGKHVRSHAQSDEASDTAPDAASTVLLDAHPEEQSNFQPDQNQRRKGTDLSQEVKEKKIHFLNISKESNTIGRGANLSLEYHHYQSPFHPKEKCATPSTVKYDTLPGEKVSPHCSTPTQKKDNVNKSNYHESEEQEVLLQHSDKRKTIKKNCEMGSSDMIDLIIRLHGDRSPTEGSWKGAEVNADVCAVVNNPRSRGYYVTKEERKPAHSAGQSVAEKEPPSGRLFPEGASPYKNIKDGGKFFLNTKANELSHEKDKIVDGVSNVEGGRAEIPHLSDSAHCENETAMSMRLTTPVSTTTQVTRVTRMSSLKKAEETKGKDLTNSNDKELVVGRIQKEGDSPKGRHHPKRALSSEASSSSEGADANGDVSGNGSGDENDDGDDHYDRHDGGVLDGASIRRGFPSLHIRSSGAEWKNGSPVSGHKCDGNVKSKRSDVDEYNGVRRVRGEGTTPLEKEGRKKHPKFYKGTCEDSSESHRINSSCSDKAASTREDYYKKGVQSEYRLRENRQSRQGKQKKMSQPSELNQLHRINESYQQSQPNRPNRRSDALTLDVKNNCHTGQEPRTGRNGKRNYLKKPEIEMEDFKMRNDMQKENKNRENSTLHDELHQWKMEGGGGNSHDEGKSLQGGPKDGKKRRNMSLVNGGHRIREVEGTWKDHNLIHARRMMKLGRQTPKRDVRNERDRRNQTKTEEDKCSRYDDDEEDEDNHAHDNKSDYENDADSNSVGRFDRRSDRDVPRENLANGAHHNDVGDEEDAGVADGVVDGEAADEDDVSHSREIQRNIDYIMQNDDIDFSRISVKPSKNYVKINLFIDRYILSYNELENSELLFCFGESSEEDVMTTRRSSVKEGGEDGGDDSQNDGPLSMRKKNAASSYKKKNRQQKNRKINYYAIDTMWQPHFHPHNKEFRVRYRYKGSMRLKTISCKHYGYLPSKKISILFLFRWLLCGKYIAEKTKRSRLSITDINDCNLPDLLSKKRNKNNGYMTDDEWKALEEKKSKEFYEHVNKINNFLISNYKDDTFVNKLKVIINGCDKHFKREEVLNILNQCLRDKLTSEQRRESLMRGDGGMVGCSVQSAVARAVDSSQGSSPSGGNTMRGTMRGTMSGRREQRREPRMEQLPRASAPPVNSKKRKRTFNQSGDPYCKESMDDGSIIHSSSGSSKGSSHGNSQGGSHEGIHSSSSIGDSMGKVIFASKKKKKESFFERANGGNEGAKVGAAQVRKKDEKNAMWRGGYNRQNRTDEEKGNGDTLHDVRVNRIGMKYLPMHCAETELSDEGGAKGDRSRNRNAELCDNKMVTMHHGGSLYHGCDEVHGRSANFQPNGNVVHGGFAKARERSLVHQGISGGSERGASERSRVDSSPSHSPGSKYLASYPSYAELEKLSNTEEIRDCYNSLIELKKSLYIRSHHRDMDDEVSYSNINDHFMELLNKESRRSNNSSSNSRHKRNSNDSMDPDVTKESDAFLFAIYYANRENVAAMGSKRGGRGMSPHSEGTTTPSNKALSPTTYGEANSPSERMQKIDFNMNQKNTEMPAKHSCTPLQHENNYLNAYPNLNNVNGSKKISNVSTCPSLGVSSYSVGSPTQGDKKNVPSCSVSNERNKIGKDVTDEEKLDYVTEQLKTKSLNMVEARELLNSFAEKYSQFIFSDRSVFLKHVRGDGQEAQRQTLEGTAKGTEEGSPEANHHELSSLGDASMDPYRFIDRHNSIASDRSPKGRNLVGADENEPRHFPVREKIVLGNEHSVRCSDGPTEQQRAYQKNPRGVLLFPSQDANSGKGDSPRSKNEPTSEGVQSEREAKLEAEPHGSLKKGDVSGDENIKDIIDILVKSKYLREANYDDSLSSNVECSHERGRSSPRCLYCACMASLNRKGVEMENEGDCVAGSNYNHEVEDAKEVEDALKGSDQKDGHLHRDEDNVERHPPCEGEEKNSLCNSSCHYCTFYTKLLKMLRQNKGVERGNGYGMNKEGDNVDWHIRKHLSNIEGPSLMREDCSEEMLTTQVNSGSNSIPPVELCNRIFNYMMQKGGSERVARGSAKDMPDRSEQRRGEMEDGAKQRAMADAIRSGTTTGRIKKDLMSAFLQELFSSVPRENPDVKCCASLSEYTEGMRGRTHNGEDENGEFADYVGENARRYNHSHGRPNNGVQNFPRSVALKDEFERPPLQNMPYIKTDVQRKKDSNRFARQAQTNEFLPLGEKQSEFIMNKDNFELITNFINDVKVKNYSTCGEMKDHRTFHDRENSITDHILPRQSSKESRLKKKKMKKTKRTKKQNRHDNQNNNYAGQGSEKESQSESEKESINESENSVLSPSTRRTLNEKMFKVKSSDNLNNSLLVDSINNNV
ncbi:hypothetical protein C922_00940 [Plasmodium inui San Antonio 1]|uniref:Uncharacterized protein n=1 Tax=Plasmodium inui San Antonio 1 TaxID=1237626 RepID=W7ASX9_9APIC|nr:hypothetical protein C922_00940 [Plasmodium inui San Antonio 1]EUD68541.1 hypothetical protein C922_00940 [Plasmodium inui San Antonio 1]